MTFPTTQRNPANTLGNLGHGHQIDISIHNRWISRRRGGSNKDEPEFCHSTRRWRNEIWCHYLTKSRKLSGSLQVALRCVDTRKLSRNDDSVVEVSGDSRVEAIPIIAIVADKEAKLILAGRAESEGLVQRRDAVDSDDSLAVTVVVETPCFTGGRKRILWSAV